MLKTAIADTVLIRIAVRLVAASIERQQSISTPLMQFFSTRRGLPRRGGSRSFHFRSLTMSRHYFTTSHKGLPTTLYLGWDRPMQNFFLVIEKPEEQIEEDTCDEHDIYLYNNLQERDPFGHGLDYYRAVLLNFQITVPESMFTEVLHDAENNVGNRVVIHQADGSFAERES
ncbi:hypothetical protein [Pectobacterium odoriferum]|uniref:hypothetical protein n=1 Tax=Pectobacterium odoriferum TaxID=78398 RepID=UPI0021562349|nr:hypothetical protein [Pectobacterium odoriferum]